MKILFICNQNQNRSKTAENLFKNKFKTKSAGLYNSSPVAEKDIFWADKVVVMEEEQRGEIARRFPDLFLKKQILNLDIPDMYSCNQPELIKELKQKVNKLL